jgi:hypothetical protein
MNPQAVSGIYANDIVSGFDVHKPERMNKLFRRYGDQGASYFMLLKSMGFEEQVAQTEYSHNEENRIHETFKVLANVTAPGAGVDASITLSPDSLDAGNRFYPRLYDVVMFPNEVTGYIAAIDTTTPTAPVLTVRPHVAADDIGALTAGDELIIISANFSEGSGQPEGATKGTFLYTNKTQIIKETIGFTGTEMTNQTWLQLNGMEGAPYYFEAQADIDYRMALKVDGALLFQKPTDNPNAVDPVTGEAIRTTEGLVPYLRRVGNNFVSAAGSFDVADFDTIDQTLEREHAGRYTMAMLGITKHQEVENVLKTYFNDTNIEYARKVFNEDIFKGDEALAATVNFKLLTKSERTFAFKRMGQFHNPKLYGATGYDMPNYGFFIPLNTRKDPKTKKNVESIGCRYKGLGAYNRRMEVWQVGGAGNGLKVTEFDKRNTYMRTDMGAHFRGGNQMILMTPS